ncbi:MAG: formate dehydrogenase subunit alpha [Chloroflexi bacterium RBG_19FT_COMBO_47_15]|nr:MAG: formate dehydrogenase subunit alpha [Chloroflexi bacterium RBG_19FT_COMBO_47_15]
MQPITITLDGREVSGYAGMSILTLARESGVRIPTLCHDERLSAIGACRLCIVEDEANGALMAACVTPLAPGMVINTCSPRVVAHRKVIVQLMLASHPDACPVCDKGNRCQLRQIAGEMGISLTELQRIPQPATIQEINPFIERDLSKCILCAKCIRACQELVVEGVLDYFQRGFKTKPTTIEDLPLENSDCTFCGTCVALCPTGALMEKGWAYKGTTKTTIQTTCPYCGCGCGVELHVKNNHLVKATPRREDAGNYSLLCVRGSYGYDFVHSPGRLTKPLVKMNGNMEEKSWDEALKKVAAEFERIKNEHGPDSIAILGSARCTNEESYLLQRFARCVIGTNNVDAGNRLYNAATVAGLSVSLGFSDSSHFLSTLEKSDVIMVIGADPTSSAPAVSYVIKRAVKYKGSRLILIDPRRIKLSLFADLHLQLRPETDIALLNALAQVIVRENLLDKEFVTRRTDNFSSLTEVLEPYSPEYVESITGVPCEQIVAAARLYARARQASIVYGNGITQYSTGTDSVKALANLSMLTGNTGRKGGGIIALQRESNSRGAVDMGLLPDFLPGFHNVTDAKARGKFEALWSVNLTTRPGLTALEMVEQAKLGRIKCLYIVGEDPVFSFPGSHAVRDALASLEFLVVQDLFLTETAKLATVVLPAASFAEKDGSFTNFEGKINRIRKAIKPVGESRSDWEIILDIADKMKSSLPYSCCEDIMGEIEESVPGYETYADSTRRYQTDDDVTGARQLQGGQMLRGFARFWPIEYKAPLGIEHKGYPFILLTGSAFPHIGTGTRSLRAPRLREFSPSGFVEVSAADAKKLALQNGNKVRISSRTGEITAPVRISNDLPQGILFIPSTFPEIPVNELFEITLDLQSKTPTSKACHVKIERTDTHG